jgi:hypothetical protein
MPPNGKLCQTQQGIIVAVDADQVATLITMVRQVGRGELEVNDIEVCTCSRRRLAASS